MISREKMLDKSKNAVYDAYCNKHTGLVGI